MEEKPWYQSKAVWGGIAAAIAGLLGLLGYTVAPEFVDSAASIGVAIASLVGGALAIFGRVKATSKLVKKS